MTDEPRTATLRTDHGTPTRAEWVAAAVTPDNTDSMATTVEGTAVRTEITRETTGGLQTTVDDYVVNLGVAQAVIEAVDDRSPGEADSSTAANQQADDTLHHE
ncbi:KEOPS complex subunit Pcc1 [Halohasta litorea]|uniref:KEOPS complex subunit Pcc1 n=1 Tax=Halohasta litorea TaxID=869891 RepID=A0ABD6DAQ5_9EURY|nr:KEOPS complex subunit Pcc1 [Halohasta litorea]